MNAAMPAHKLFPKGRQRLGLTRRGRRPQRAAFQRLNRRQGRAIRAAKAILSLYYDTTAVYFGKREIMWFTQLWIRFYLENRFAHRALLSTCIIFPPKFGVCPGYQCVDGIPSLRLDKIKKAPLLISRIQATGIPLTMVFVIQ